MTYTKKHTNNFARILALLLNIIIFPGLGTLLAGKRNEAFWQIGLVFFSLFTFATGLIFTITIIGAIIGIPLMIIAPGIYVAAWVWSLLSVLR